MRDTTSLFKTLKNRRYDFFHLYVAQPSLFPSNVCVTYDSHLLDNIMFG